MTLESRFRPVPGNPMLTYKWETQDTIRLGLDYTYSDELKRNDWGVWWFFDGTYPDPATPEQVRDTKRLISVIYQTVAHLAYDCGWADEVVPSPDDKVELDSGIFIESTLEHRKEGRIQMAVKIKGEWVEWNIAPTKELLRFIMHLIYHLFFLFEKRYDKIQIIDQNFVA